MVKGFEQPREQWLLWVQGQIEGGDLSSDKVLENKDRRANDKACKTESG